MRKGEIACNKQFLLFSQCFLPYMALNFHFKCTLKCLLQFVSIKTSPKFCHLVNGLNSISVITRRTVHLSMFFLPVFCIPFFSSHWLLTDMIIVDGMDRGERKESCSSDYQQPSESILAEPEI